MSRIIFLLLLCISPVLLIAQDNGPTLLKNAIKKRAIDDGGAYEVAPTSKTTIAPVNFLFSVYRNVISEQISAECAFNLSCSRFSAACIKEHGFAKGILLTGDRLTRCHVFIANETIPVLFDNNTGKVIDEPKQY